MKPWLSATLAALVLASGSAPAAWKFTELNGAAGKPLRGGIAAGDYDNDGDTDIYLVAAGDVSNQMLRNNSGVFEDVTAVAGVALIGHEGLGAAFADINNDGWQDLLVGGANGSGIRVFKNQGDGTFSDHTQASGLYLQSKDQNDFSFGFGDPDEDGDLDVFVAHWGTDDKKADNFWLNDGTGHFIRADGIAGITVFDDFDHSFSPVFTDITGDGKQDLLVAADFGTSQVLVNTGQAEFELATTEVIDDEFGMGQAAADFDNDGDIDWFVTSIFGTKGGLSGGDFTGNRLYLNDGDGNFVDGSESAGVRNGYWGWGACAADFNNDGWLDVFHVNGANGISGESEAAADPSVLFVNQGDGTFSEQAKSLGIDDEDQGLGVVCFDLEGDGDVDILVANQGLPWRLFRNDPDNENRWLQVSLVGNQHTSAAGARISLEYSGKQQVREVTVGSNFMSQNPLLQHFGLADTVLIDTLRVTWPDGSETIWDDVATNQRVEIEASKEAVPPLFQVEPGTSSAWFDPSRNGEGFLIEVLEDDWAVLYWFTYDDEGSQDWYVAVGRVEGQRILFPELVQAAGGEFGPGFDPSRVTRTVVGTAAFTWHSCGEGVMDWTLFPGEPGQRHGRQQLTRLTTLMSLHCGDPIPLPPEIPQGQYSGSWFDPTHDGEGYVFQVLIGGEVLLYWFTFDTEGNRRWFFNVGEVRDGVLVFDELFSTSGAKFGDAFDPDDLVLTPWGSLELEIDCDGGEARYSSSLEAFGSGTLNVIRLTTLKGLECH